MAKKAKKTAAKRSAARTSTSAKRTKTAVGRKSAARKPAARKAAGRKAAGRKSSGRKPNAAFMAPMTPSPQLAEVIGSKPMPRTEVTKRLWAYIKKNGLQDSSNRRVINADATLKPVFGGKASVNMFDMTKLVSRHPK